MNAPRAPARCVPSHRGERLSVESGELLSVESGERPCQLTLGARVGSFREGVGDVAVMMMEAVDA
eukprot:COSAG01_NODE_2384_length_7788_cov_8.398751_5_plen_65_part_00